MISMKTLGKRLSKKEDAAAPYTRVTDYFGTTVLDKVFKGDSNQAHSKLKTSSTQRFLADRGSSRAQPSREPLVTHRSGSLDDFKTFVDSDNIEPPNEDDLVVAFESNSSRTNSGYNSSIFDVDNSSRSSTSGNLARNPSGTSNRIDDALLDF